MVVKIKRFIHVNLIQQYNGVFMRYTLQNGASSKIYENPNSIKKCLKYISILPQSKTWFTPPC